MKKKIIIADDDIGILDCVSMMLEFGGYEVTAVSNGNELLSMGEYPDLLLLDIWMSGVDGRDICKKLKTQESTRNLPIILVSASKDIERSARVAGADDFLSKPFEMDELFLKIEQHIA